MAMDDSNAKLEVQSLRRDLEMRGLDVLQVWVPNPADPQLECRQLLNLLEWVRAYEKHPDRQTMEGHGYDFPPIDPDCDPDTDWLRFETWMRRETVREKLRNKLALEEVLLPSTELTDAQIEQALTHVLPALERLQISFERDEGMPARLFYEEVLEALEEDYEILAPGTTWHLDGCDGFCPECRRRPWCDNGLTLWPEDEEAGCMVVPDAVRPYVTAADVSLSRLELSPL